MMRGAVLCTLALGSTALQCPRARSVRLTSLASTPIEAESEVDIAAAKEELLEIMRGMEHDDFDAEFDTSGLPEREFFPEGVDDGRLSTPEGMARAEDWMGEFEGVDEPNDAPWRAEAEVLIRGAIAAHTDEPRLEVCDVMWDYGTLRVAIERSGERGFLDGEDVFRATVAIREALEPRDADLQILTRHDLEVTSPGASDVLTMQKDFVAFKGFEVTVETANPIVGGKPRTIVGTIMERNPIELVLNLKGRIVKIPYHLVTEVKLPPAKSE